MPGIVLTGMHRSGTSLFARYMQQCGMHIGTNLLQEGRAGHSENRDFLMLHVKIMQREKIHVFDLQKPIRTSPQDKLDAKKIYNKYANMPLWGFKDPRTCLFLDFWNQVNNTLKFIFIYRNPELVFQSLKRRSIPEDLYATGKGKSYVYDVWAYNNKRIVNFYENHKQRCLLFNIQHFIQYPHQIIRKINNKFGTNIRETPLDKIFKQSIINNNEPNMEDWHKPTWNKLESLCGK